MSCPFSLGKCLSYKHQSLLLPPSWEQSGVCPFELPWQPTEEVVPTLSAKDKVTNDPWQQMRYPVFIHFFSWLKLHFFLIVLSTNCLWLYWWVDWNKFDDPQKSFLGKWCLRRWKKKKKKVMNLLSLHAKCHVSHLFGLHFSKCGQSKSDYSIGCIVRGLTWILSLNTVGM